MVGLGAVDQQLLRHAPADHAGATDAIPFDDGHPRAMPRRRFAAARPPDPAPSTTKSKDASMGAAEVAQFS